MARTDETMFAMIQWRAVFAGAVLGLATMILLTALWVAAGFGSQVEAVRTNIDWFLAGSAILAVLIGGFLAGWLAGIRGWGIGLMHGLTVWALVLVSAVVIGLPSVAGVLQVDVLQSLEASGTTVPRSAGWTTFWSLLIGFGAAGLGGVLGGGLVRPSGLYAARGHHAHEHEHRAAS